MERKLVGYVCFSPKIYNQPRVSYGLPMPQNPHMPALKTSNVHLDVLMGRDEAVECADFMMPGMSILISTVAFLMFSDVILASEMTPSMDIHADMERKLRM